MRAAVMIMTLAVGLLAAAPARGDTISFEAMYVQTLPRVQTTDAHRPSLSTEQRERILPAFADDIRLLSEITGEDYSDWLSSRDRGSFAQRAAQVQLSEPA